MEILKPVGFGNRLGTGEWYDISVDRDGKASLDGTYVASSQHLEETDSEYFSGSKKHRRSCVGRPDILATRMN